MAWCAHHRQASGAWRGRFSSRPLTSMQLQQKDSGCIGNDLHVVPQGFRSAKVLVCIQKEDSAIGLQNLSSEGVLVQATSQGCNLLHRSQINIRSLSAPTPFVMDLAAFPAAESPLQYQVEILLPTAS